MHHCVRLNWYGCTLCEYGQVTDVQHGCGTREQHIAMCSMLILSRTVSSVHSTVGALVARRTVEVNAASAASARHAGRSPRIKWEKEEMALRPNPTTFFFFFKGTWMGASQSLAAAAGVTAAAATGQIASSSAHELVAGIFCVWVFTYVRRAGLFLSPTASKGRFPGGMLMYKHYVGPYRECGKAFETLEKTAKTGGVDHAWSAVGVYYDNPKRLAEAGLADSMCRYAVGALVDRRAKNTQALFKQEGYSAQAMPEFQAAVSEFPFTGLLSILLGLWKVYPRLDEFSRRHGLKEDQIGPFCEVCGYESSTRAMKVDYYAPLEERQQLLLGLPDTNVYASDGRAWSEIPLKKKA